MSNMNISDSRKMPEAVGEQVIRDGYRGTRTMLAQQEANKQLRVQVAFEGGARLAAITDPKALAMAAKFQADWMGMLAAATAPTTEKLPKLEQKLAATETIAVDMPHKPGVTMRVRYTGPKNTL